MLLLRLLFLSQLVKAEELLTAEFISVHIAGKKSEWKQFFKATISHGTYFSDVKKKGIKMK